LRKAARLAHYVHREGCEPSGCIPEELSHVAVNEREPGMPSRASTQAAALPAHGLAEKLRRARMDPLLRYGLALAFAALALGIRGSLPVPEGTTVYQLPLTAVVLSAWLGGRGPGWCTLLVCAVGIVYWLIPPADSFHVSPDYLLGFCLFIGLGVLLVEFSAARWRVEHELQESDDRFRSMAATVPQMLWFESVEPRELLYVSPRYEQIWGRPMRELARDPQAWLEAIHPEDRSAVRDAYERWLAGEGNGRFDATFRITRSDGETRFIHSRGTLIRDAHGRPHRASRASEDVTEARRAAEALTRAEAELAHVARVTTMGQLAASIAHEVNQPLGAMVANAAAAERWLAATPPETTRAREALTGIVEDGQRAGAVIGRVRALLKREPRLEEPLDLNEAIREVLALTRQDPRRNDVVVEALLGDALPRVRGDKIQLQQVLLNLTVNALEAMNGVPDAPRTLTVQSERDGAGGVQVTVRDTGAGLDAGGSDRLFDPFYTTKAGGMGMGLAISRSIIEAHGGRIWAAPNSPRGAVFRFALPAGPTF
jgi:PAS domain S-box-containing protein